LIKSELIQIRFDKIFKSDLIQIKFEKILEGTCKRKKINKRDLADFGLNFPGAKSILPPALQIWPYL